MSGTSQRKTYERYVATQITTAQPGWRAVFVAHPGPDGRWSLWEEPVPVWALFRVETWDSFTDTRLSGDDSDYMLGGMDPDREFTQEPMSEMGGFLGYAAPGYVIRDGDSFVLAAERYIRQEEAKRGTAA